jgi:phosphonate transport system ATP-binding protein
MLQLSRLSLSYGEKTVVRDLSLELIKGERLAIIGSSGAGKSTLLAHIYRQLKPRAALCSQSQGLVDGLSVFHNVYMGALARNSRAVNLLNLLWPQKTPRLQVQSLCEALELDCSLTTRVDRLSGGQRQRVALARACFQHRSVFIGDEPLSALDPLMAARLLEWIQQRHETLIMVLHNRALALSHFDRIIGLRAGELVLDSPSAALSLAQLDEFYTQAELPLQYG